MRTLYKNHFIFGLFSKKFRAFYNSNKPIGDYDSISAAKAALDYTDLCASADKIEEAN